MGDSSKGLKYVTIIGIYMVVKSVINLLLGFSLTNIIMLVVSAVLGYAMRNRRKPFDVATAVFLLVVALMHFKANIDGRQFLYLAEGIADIVFGVGLLVQKDIKAYFG